MLTQLQESSREKCFPYFPTPSHPTMQINTQDEFKDGETATVTLVKTEADPRARATVRTMHMTVGGRTKEVRHLAFEAWPDFLVPEGDDRAALVELVRLSNRLNRAAAPSTSGNSLPLQSSNAGTAARIQESPRIVHCSAGVGRSGTFIALDFLLGELEDGALDRVPEGVDPVVEVVETLRTQRMMMVQGEGQMRFLYEAVGELWRERFAGGVRR